jgi:hypothetical protein
VSRAGHGRRAATLPPFVQLGRGSRAGPGACSVTRAAAQGCLLAGTSQAIGKRLCGHIVRTTVTPEFVPKRNSELSGNRGLRPASAASLEIGENQVQTPTALDTCFFVSAVLGRHGLGAGGLSFSTG